MDEWIETGTGNRISRSAAIKDASRISIGENCTICEHCTLNGDVVTASTKSPSIVIGKFAYLGPGCLIDPPLEKTSGKNPIYAEVQIGNYTTIGPRSVVRSAQVGNRVLIGTQCTLGSLSVINDCCIIDDRTVIPAHMVIPPYSRVSGAPGKSLMVEPISAAYRKVIEVESRIRHVL